MTESILIWKFLASAYPDNHQVVYLYCSENPHKSVALKTIIPVVMKVFSLETPLVKIVVKAYLERKKKMYMKGELKLNPLY